ncbi:DinB family protein [soil metagenome]
MSSSEIILELEKNPEIFLSLLQVSKFQQFWKPKVDKWCLLEVVCHLLDEEREDFRTRLKFIFENPGKALKPIDPEGWVKERNYLQQDFDKVLSSFIQERKKSVEWLKSIQNPLWKNTAKHQGLGDISAELLLANWLAHDYFHFRQIIRLKYEYLKQSAAIPLDYAGNW